MERRIEVREAGEDPGKRALWLDRFQHDAHDLRLPALGGFLGNGLYGLVFESADHPESRVVKLTRVHERDIQDVKKSVGKLKKRPHPSAVRIHDFGFSEKKLDRYFCAFFVTERLKPIGSESFNVATMFSALMAGSDPRECYSWKRYAAPRPSRVWEAQVALRRWPIKHTDLHDANVMQDSRGKYKLIDPESIRA